MGSPEQRPQTVDEVDHWLVLVNPLSTGAKRARRVLFELKTSEHRSKVEVIEPSSDESPQHAQERLLGRLSLGSGVVLLGGDGTLNHFINGLMSDERLRRLGTPVLPAGNGHGNDSATTHIGNPKRANLAQVLSKGSIRPIHPIVTKTTGGETSETRYAVAYMGLGGTAYGAALFDAPAHRHGLLSHSKPTRLLSDAGLVARSVLEAPTFEVRQPDGAAPVTLSELSIANYPREAIYGRWPIAPSDPDLLVSWVEGKSLRRSVEWLGRLAAGSLPILSEIIDPPKTVRLRPHEKLRFVTGGEPTPIHWDAETGLIPAQADVTISSNPEPFYGIATRF